MSQDFEPQNGFEKSAEFYLEAAQFALMSGKPKLAMHLYRAAYEVEEVQSGGPTAHVIDGLRKAWDLACEHNDRSMAESVFTDLSAHNSTEENEQAVLRLQSLALNQLEDMGISELDIENIASAVSRELGESERDDILNSIKDVLGQLGEVIEEDSSTTDPSKDGAQNAAIVKSNKPSKAEVGKGLAKLNDQLLEMRKRNQGRADDSQLSYQHILGFETTLERMREYGFAAPGDEAFKRFIKRSADIHGVHPLSLHGSFVFYGRSRDDVNLFGHATAGEIGLPIIHVVVDLDEHGNGTIKLAGPFKRSIFGGAPDLINMPSPCVVVIENIDHLQTMFDNEQKAFKHHGGQMRTMMGGRSMQAEITTYLRAIRQRQDIFMIATAESTASLKKPLRDLLGTIHHIEIDDPHPLERMNILLAFADEHPSFQELDLDAVARYSDGLSRRELIMACGDAVESAYRESLRTNVIAGVALGDVLVNIAMYLDNNSELHHQIEDAAVAQLYRDIDQEML